MVYDEATSSGTHTNVISPQKNYVAQSKNDYFTDEGKKSSETDDVRDQKALNKDDDVYNEPLAIINIDNPNRGKRKRVTKVGIMTNKSSESLQNEIKNLNSKLNHLVTVIDGEINQLATVESGSPTDDSSQLLVETTSKIGDSGTEIQAGLVIEELEPITTDKRRQKKRAPRRKEKSKGKLKDPIKSDFSSDADPSLAGETEMLSDLQRVLTSNIMSSTSLNKPRSKRGKYSPPWCGDEERPLVGNPVTVSDNSDVTINTKLLTELQRLLTQNNIRTVLNEEKKQIERRKSRPSLDSPPYIRPPHDTSSQDGTKFNLDMKKFPCSQCNKEFKTKQCLKRHIGRHLGVKPYACSFCKKRFNDKTNLGRHERVHMNIRKHVCDVCPQAFFRKEEMEKHKRIKHTIPDDIMKCKFKDCDYVCNLPSKLVEHIQTVHFGNYRYNCDKCNFRTQNITNYNNHLRVHSNERPFKCPKCGKGFKQWNGLEAHKKVHLKKDHICEICLKTFNLESSLKSHYDVSALK